MTEEGRPRFALPTQEQVIHRALGLHAVVLRAALEDAFQLCKDLPAEELSGFHTRVAALQDWMSRERVREHLSPLERTSWFAVPLGKWKHQALADATWRRESLGVLLWALSALPELPPYDVSFHEQVHLQTIGWLQPTAEFIAHARLRPEAELAHGRDLAELWHWRARTTQLQREGRKLPPGVNLKQVIATAAEAAHQRGDMSRPLGHDFPAFGKSYARLNNDEYSFAMSIARERHFALNWLCGYAQDWDSTPTET